MNVNSNSDYQDISRDLERETKIHSIKDVANQQQVDTHKSKLWIITALLAGVSFGLSNIFMGKTSHYGIYSREVVSVGALVFSILYLVIQLSIRYYKW